jgi:CRISPR/Cas system-associated exonuclease Cas4 (RecB family)
MAKTIDTLINDMNNVILGLGGWDSAITRYLAESISEVAENRFSKPQEPRGYLSLSALGDPCERSLWYKVNMSDKGEPLSAESLGTFFYGDLLEAFIIAVVKASGHKVEGEQDRLDVHGIKGHRDVIIDGVTVDVKSASSYGFEKFAKGSLREDDPFGYISQLSSYVYAGKDDPKVTDKKRGAFLAVKKDRFKLALDMYDFSKELETKEKEIEQKKALVAGDIPEDRLAPVPQSKTSPNMKLNTKCGYCQFRKICWPEVRTFIYSSGPLFLAEVKKEPNVPELVE